MKRLAWLIAIFYLVCWKEWTATRPSESLVCELTFAQMSQSFSTEAEARAFLATKKADPKCFEFSLKKVDQTTLPQ